MSLYYYFGLVRALYMRAPAGVGIAAAGGQPPRELALQTAVLGCLVVTVGSFFFVDPLIRLCRHGGRVARLPVLTPTAT